MGKITRWHFVRHAPVINAPKSLLYATPDEPADCSDAASFGGLATFLPIDALLLTTGLQRTEATADAIAGKGWTHGTRQIEERLAEQHYGDWHGRDLNEIRRTEGGDLRHKHWMTTADDLPTGGESFRMVAARVAQAMDEWTARVGGGAIVAVAHGGTIRAALAHALGIDLDRALTISVENLSTTRIDHVPGEGLGGDWRVVYVNRRPR